MSRNSFLVGATGFPGGVLARHLLSERHAAYGGTRAPLLTLAMPNARWSVNFVHEQFGLWPALSGLQRG